MAFSSRSSINSQSRKAQKLRLLLSNNNFLPRLRLWGQGTATSTFPSHGVALAALQLTYLSVDGEQGFPGNLAVKVVYSLTAQNELMIQYSATTDKETVINLDESFVLQSVWTGRRRHSEPSANDSRKPNHGGRFFIDSNRGIALREEHAL